MRPGDDTSHLARIRMAHARPWSGEARFRSAAIGEMIGVSDPSGPEIQACFKRPADAAGRPTGCARRRTIREADLPTCLGAGEPEVTVVLLCTVSRRARSMVISAACRRGLTAGPCFPNATLPWLRSDFRVPIKSATIASAAACQSPSAADLLRDPGPSFITPRCVRTSPPPLPDRGSPRSFEAGLPCPFQLVALALRLESSALRGSSSKSPLDAATRVARKRDALLLATRLSRTAAYSDREIAETGHDQRARGPPIFIARPALLSAYANRRASHWREPCDAGTAQYP